MEDFFMNDKNNLKHNDPQPDHGNDSKGHNGNENRGNHTGHEIKPGKSHGEPLCSKMKLNQ